jgi:membrane protease YdiL (CAAX protease family)
MARTTASSGIGSGIGLYLLLTLLLSGIFYALIIGTGQMGAGRGMYVLGLMWCPGVAAVLTCRLRRDSLDRLGWHWGEWRWQWTAYLVPLAYTAVAYLIIWTTGLGGFGNPEFIAGLGKTLGWEGAPAWLNVAAFFLLAACVMIIRAVASGLGEEIGWRGFLAPALTEKFGFTRGAFLTGLIWGAWHLPILLFADYNAGTPWWFGAPCFLVSVISSSVIMNWLRLRSGSLWTAAVVHGSHNLFIQVFFTPITAPRGEITKYAIDEFGFVLPLVLAAFAFYFWRRRHELPGAG